MDYRCVTSLPQLREYLNGADIVSFDFETAPAEAYRDEPYAALDPNKSQIAGISFSRSEGTGVYLPVSHRIGRNAEDPAEIWTWLSTGLFNSSTITKVCHNMSFESSFLYARGIVLQPPVYDTMLAGQLTLKAPKTFRAMSDCGLKTLAAHLFDIILPDFETVTGGRCFDELDPQNTETIHYTCADSDYALRLYHKLNSWFDRGQERSGLKHRQLVELLESPAAVYTGLMRYNGLPVDKPLMLAKKAEAEEHLSQLRQEIDAITGGVDIGSNAGTRAFRTYIYGTLGLPVFIRTAKNKESMDEEAFVLLREWCCENLPDHERLFTLVLEYRAIGKVYSTYIQGYLKHINTATGRIHPQLLPMGAESGRFSCRQPNIQNQKSGGDINVRDFIIAPEGCSLIELDYSQIEARLAAYLSRDERLLEIYRDGGDLHAMTAAAIFSIPIEEAADKKHPQYKRRRVVAKMTFFGFLYGIYAKSLQRNLKLDAGINAGVEECKHFLANLASSHPILTGWQKCVISAAKTKQYAETALGRRRYVPLIRSADFMKRGTAERAALNHGVQGLAADLLKLAMARLITLVPLYLRPLFTVHDSLVFACPDEKITEAAALVKTAMETLPPIDGFDVSIVAEISVGRKYGSLEELT